MWDLFQARPSNRQKMAVDPLGCLSVVPEVVLQILPLEVFPQALSWNRLFVASRSKPPQQVSVDRLSPRSSLPIKNSIDRLTSQDSMRESKSPSRVLSSVQIGIPSCSL